MSTGNAEAIRDWFKGKFISKSDVYEYLFTKYTITFIGLPNEIVTIVDKYRTQTVEIGSTGTETVDMYFIPGMTVDISMNTFEVSYTFGSQTVITIDVLDGILPLYWYGNTCDHITGGYEAVGAKTWSGSPSTTAQPPTVTYNSDNVYLEHDTQNIAWASKCGAWKPINKIDITGYTKIHVRFNAYCYNYRTSQGMNAVCSVSITDTMQGVITDNTGDGGVADQFYKLCIAENGNPREKSIVDGQVDITFNSAVLTRGEDFFAFIVEANTGKAQLRLKEIYLTN